MRFGEVAQFCNSSLELFTVGRGDSRKRRVVYLDAVGGRHDARNVEPRQISIHAEKEEHLLVRRQLFSQF